MLRRLFPTEQLCRLVAVVLVLALVDSFAARAAEDGNDGMFIEIQPLSVSVVQNNRVVGYLSVAYSLMPQTPEAASKIEQLLPRLDDAVVKMLSRIARTRLDVAKPLNVELIHTYLQRTVNTVLGGGTATVLLQDASLQPG